MRLSCRANISTTHVDAMAHIRPVITACVMFTQRPIQSGLAKGYRNEWLKYTGIGLPPQNKENRQMNLTPSERAAMVKDLERMAHDYKLQSLRDSLRANRLPTPATIEFKSKMAENYSALASALKEGLTFEAMV